MLAYAVGNDGSNAIISFLLAEDFEASSTSSDFLESLNPSLWTTAHTD